MHIYFSGIGGTGIGPLALLAHQAGYTVSGSDKQQSDYITYLRKHGVNNITIGQKTEDIAAVHAATPIDWFVYSSALPKENPHHPELAFVNEHGIKHSKRDEFLNSILVEKNLKLLAIAGTHGKTTTTAMAIWLFKQLGLPISYSVGAKLSFGEMGEFDPKSEYFVYECDEYDRNFLSFKPFVAAITGVDWDHADVYPTRDDYENAFRVFLAGSEYKVLWQKDAHKLAIAASNKSMILQEDDAEDEALQVLRGEVNRKNAWQVANMVHGVTELPLSELLAHLQGFPGVARRFEHIVPGLVTDYAHTPPKIAGALQMAHEVAGPNVVVMYEGLHNTRQHFIKEDLAHLFDSAKKLYVVPSYLAREDPKLALLSPKDIIKLTSRPQYAQPAELNDDLKRIISNHLAGGDLVLCLTAGGGGSLDEWLREEFKK